MNDSTKDNSDPKNTTDGFDFLEFPCEFAFKAMCRVDAVTLPPKDIVRGLVAGHVGEVQIIDLRSTMSRTGKFESVTITVHLADRALLEAVYRAFSESSEIVMTL